MRLLARLGLRGVPRGKERRWYALELVLWLVLAYPIGYVAARWPHLVAVLGGPPLASWVVARLRRWRRRPSGPGQAGGSPSMPA